VPDYSRTARDPRTGDLPATRFVERRSVIAIVYYTQRDEPPGRGDIATREIVIAAKEQHLNPNEVASTVTTVHEELFRT
jgi:hypothetical protein